MLFMVIETFRDGDPKPVYRRFKEKGRMAPTGRAVCLELGDDGLRALLPDHGLRRPRLPRRMDVELDGHSRVRGHPGHFVGEGHGRHSPPPLSDLLLGFGPSRFRPGLLRLIVPVLERSRRQVATTEPECQPTRDRQSADEPGEQRVDQIRRDPQLVDCNHDRERPHRRARDVRKRLRIREPRFGRRARTMLPSARAAIPPMKRTKIATTRFGSHNSSCRITSETAGSPSASNATSSTTTRTIHFTTPATIPTESIPVPILFMKSESPDFCISSSNRITRRSPVTPFASNDETNQPIATMMMNASILGIAPRTIAKASRNDVISVSVKEGRTTVV